MKRMDVNPNEKQSQSQRAQILQALKNGARLTPRDARVLFNSERLAARICELRQAGYEIKTKLIAVPSGKRVAQYRLEDD